MKCQTKTSFSSTGALARALGLSRWSVSRALNGRGGVSAETVRRVRKAAEENGFLPSALARGLRAGVTDLVGLCVPDLEEYQLSEKVLALQSSLTQGGLESVLSLTDGNLVSEERAIKRFFAMRCRVVVVFASRGVRPGYPGVLVYVDPIVATGVDPGLMSVSADRAGAMRMGIAHLAKLGHGSACLAGFNPRGSYFAARRRGLEQGVRKAGWKNLIHLRVDEMDDFGVGEFLAQSYIGLGEKRPRAILAVNDRIAFAMQVSLRRKGFHCPKDYSILGYAGSRLCEFADPPLTTIDPMHEDIMEATAKLVLSPAPARLLIKPRLVVRGSTAPPG